MAKMEVRGVEEYALKLSRLGNKTELVAGKAIYGAAGMVADQVRNNLQALTAVPDIENIKAYHNKEKMRLSYTQKKGLLDSFGITKMELDRSGFYCVKLGFDGYNDIKTRKYPKGQPNPLIARVTESGSVYMDKTPFIRTAVNSIKKAALKKMQITIDDEMQKIMK